MNNISYDDFATLEITNIFNIIQTYRLNTN